MTARLNSRLVLVSALALATALGVSACGKRGTLDRPAPMWGHPKDKTTGDGGEQRSGPVHNGNPADQTPDGQNRTIAQDPMSGVPAGPDSGPGNPSNLVPHK